MTSAPEGEPLVLDGHALEVKWGTPGEHCYCTTGSSDFCDFCNEWTRDCYCEHECEDAGSSYADKVNAPLLPEAIEALRKALESGEHARFRRVQRDGGKT